MQQFINNFGGAITADMLAAALTIQIPDALAVRIPATPSPQEPVYLTLYDDTDPNKIEILRLVGLNSGTVGGGLPITYDVQRPLEGTAAQDWLTGDLFESRITADITRQLHPDSILTSAGEVLTSAGNVLTGV